MERIDPELFGELKVEKLDESGKSGGIGGLSEPSAPDVLKKQTNRLPDLSGKGPADLPEVTADDTGAGQVSGENGLESEEGTAYKENGTDAVGKEQEHQPADSDKKPANKDRRDAEHPKKHSGHAEKSKKKFRRKRSRVGNFFRCIIFCALLGGVLFYVGRIVESKAGVERVRPFLQEEETPDVLFFGTSHVIYGVYPMELWNDYGIASYNLGASQSTLAMTYWNIMQALEYSSPQLIVVDCSGLRDELKIPATSAMVNRAFDAYPLNATKYAAIMDLMDDPYLETAIENGEVTEEEASQRNIWSYLFNIIAYHGRWESLTSKDYTTNLNTQKGALYITDVAVTNEYPQTKSTVLDSETLSMEYLRKIIDAARSRGIDILLTYIPFSANVGRQKEAHSAGLIAEEMNVPYINFLDLGIVDYSTDSADTGTHLNVSGARKVTDYLGNYIRENYDLPDRRTDEAYSYWFDDYSDYVEMKEETLSDTDEIINYLMLLSDDDYDAVIEIGSPDALLLGELPDYLRNLGVNTDDIAADSEYILIKGGREATILYECRGDELVQQTVLGEFVSYYDENGIASYRLNGTDFHETEEVSANTSSIRITVMKTGHPETVVDKVVFRYQQGYSLETKSAQHDSHNGETDVNKEQAQNTTASANTTSGENTAESAAEAVSGEEPVLHGEAG